MANLNIKSLVKSWFTNEATPAEPVKHYGGLEPLNYFNTHYFINPIISVPFDGEKTP